MKCEKFGYDDHGTGDFSHVCAASPSAYAKPGAVATDERALFEVEMRKQYGEEHFKKIETLFDGICYRSESMNGALSGWQAHAALAAPAPATSPVLSARDRQIWANVNKNEAKDLEHYKDLEIADLCAMLAANKHCEWPNCMTEKARQELAAQAYSELYSGVPATPPNSIHTCTPPVETIALSMSMFANKADYLAAMEARDAAKTKVLDASRPSEQGIKD